MDNEQKTESTEEVEVKENNTPDVETPDKNNEDETSAKKYTDEDVNKIVQQKLDREKEKRQHHHTQGGEETALSANTHAGVQPDNRDQSRLYTAHMLHSPHAVRQSLTGEGRDGTAVYRQHHRTAHHARRRLAVLRQDVHQGVVRQIPRR